MWQFVKADKDCAVVSASATLPAMLVCQQEEIMRGAFGAMAIAIVISFSGSAGAVALQTGGSIDATPVASKNIVVAQRCRCVERRWNGSCKLRVCRDHW
jgi:hypothetical protein